MDTNKEDAMEAEQILAEVHKLITREKGENQENVDEDVKNLEDAAESLAKFIEGEQSEGADLNPGERTLNPMNPVQAGIVDTGVLTGPINGLKNFLVKKQQDIEGQ